MPTSSEAPWLDNIEASVGVKEIAGAKANPAILGYFADVGHPECKSDEIAWCAARVGSALVRCGLPIPATNVNLMARSYLSYGVECEPKRGAILVLPRGDPKGWQGHVGVVTEVKAKTVKYVAGNQSNGVAYGTAKIADVLPGGFRWPVAPDVAELRKAGSTEIKQADRIENGGWLTTFISVITATLKSMLGPVEVPEFASVTQSLSWWQTLLGGINAVGKLVADHPWLAGTTFLGLLCLLVGRSLKAGRIKKHAAGVPLSVEVAKLAEPAPVDLKKAA